MLLKRSICSIVCLLVLSPCLCQNYDSDYDGPSSYNEGSDHSSYGDGDHDNYDGGKPDYSSYFAGSQASPAPLVGNVQSEGEGFVQPLDFSGFFVSPSFGFGAASTPVQTKKQNGFVNPADFQPPVQQGGFQTIIQHPVAAAQNFENFFVPSPTDYKTYSPKSKTVLKQNTDSSEVEDLNEYKYLADDDDDNDDNEKTKNPPKLTYAKSKYAPGKSSYVSQVKNYPLATNTNLRIQPTLTPYQKYSFQPVSSLKSASFENIQSTPIPYRSQYVAQPKTEEYAQSTSPNSQKLKGNCKRVDKQISKEDISHGRFRRGAEEMNCFVCQDPKTGGSYEQCSYTSDPNNSEYFKGHASKYSTQSYTPDTYRNKRSPRKQDKRNKRQKEEEQEEEAEEVEEYKNPFDNEKENAHSFNSKPEEFDSDNYYKAPDFSNFKDDYRFGPEYFTDATNEEKSYSEKEAEELKKNSDNCKQVKKDSLTCMVCKNPKTGGNYEQCSYSSEPEEKRYAYVKEKKYNSNDPQENAEEKDEEETEQKPVRSRLRQKPQKKIIENYEYNPQPTQSRQRKVKSHNADGYEVFHPTPISRNENQKDSNKYSGLNPELYGKSEEEEEETQQKGDYVYKLFPEYAEKESQIKEAKQKPGFEYQSDLPEYFTAEESKKDVDSVLAEFAKKDRSNCKKIAKDKMTCFVCTDRRGVNHEECMFVSESAPQSSHLAYHEVKEFSSDPQNSENKQESIKVIPSREPEISASNKRRKIQKKEEEFEAQPEPTNVPTTRVPRIARRKTNINKELAEEKKIQKREAKKVDEGTIGDKRVKEEEELADDDDVVTENSDGAYASELVPIFSKKLGTTLPKYMLDISEHERIFDEVVASGP